MSLKHHLNHRILILDGAMATMLPLHSNDSDEVHRLYLEAGADIIKTHTFHAPLDFESNFMAVERAKKLAQHFSTKEKPRFVAAVVGPHGKATEKFEDLLKSYTLQVSHLIKAGPDLFLIETILDLNNMKAALSAIKNLNTDIPIMVSCTLQKNGKNIFAGESLEDFISLACEFNVFSIGINCSHGPANLNEALTTLNRTKNMYISLHPNSESSQTLINEMKRYLDQKLVNMIGGCCGTNETDIRNLAELAKGYSPRTLITI